MMLYVFVKIKPLPTLRSNSQPFEQQAQRRGSCAKVDQAMLQKMLQVAQPFGSGMPHAQAYFSEQVDLKTAGTGCFIPQREAAGSMPHSAASAGRKADFGWSGSRHPRYNRSKGKEKAVPGGTGAFIPSP
jgi:hypothetical protein